jgi:C4-dicarboxylate-binding protein DctP
VIVNKSFWEGLPAEVRTGLTQAVKESTVFEREIAQKENDEALAKVIAARTTTVYTLTAAEKTEWQKVLLPIHREFESVVGADTLQSVYATAAQVAKEQAAALAAKPAAKAATKK